jgi:protease-4
MSNQFSSEDAQVLLNKMVYDFMKQQRHQRIWRWVKRCIYLIVFLFLGYNVLDSKLESSKLSLKPHIGLIDISGEISESAQSNSDAFGKSLSNAYKNEMMKAVIIRINSPGGSPVQADYMYNIIRHYQKKYPKVKVHAVCVDTCASAAYYVASAADDIYANPSSLVGSIGVIFDGFGFNDLMQKVGVSRRMVTAGKNKGFLDPFSPESAAQTAYLQTMLGEIHQQFINKVKEGRGARLKINDDTFSGLAWTGIEAKNMGLVDGFASAGDLMRNTLKIEDAIDYTEKLSVVEQVSKNVGASFKWALQELIRYNLG